MYVTPEFPFVLKGTATDQPVISELGKDGDPPPDMFIADTWWNGANHASYDFVLSWHRPSHPFSLNDLEEKSFQSLQDTSKKLLRHAFNLSDGEAIVGLYAYIWDGYLLGLQLMTNLRLSEFSGICFGDLHFFQQFGKNIGGKGGAPMGLTGLEYTIGNVDFDKNMWVHVISERSMRLPKDVTFGWTTTSLPRMRKLVVGTALGGRDETKMIFSGRQSFNTLSAVKTPGITTLTKVVVHYDNKITGIDCYYSDTTVAKVGRASTDEKTISLATSEYIKEIQVHSDTGINCLQFFTSNGTISEKLGGTDGSFESWDGRKVRSTDSPAAQYMALIGFSGIYGISGTPTGDMIWRLAPIWSSIPASKYVLKITSEPPSVVSTTMQLVDNWVLESNVGSPGNIQASEDFKRSYTATSKLSITNESSESVEVGAEIEEHAGLEIEGLFKLGGSLKSTTKDTRTSLTKAEDAKEMTELQEYSLKVDVTVPPWTTIKFNAQIMQGKVENYRWSGIMTATYPDGSTLDTNVSGIWDATRFSEVHMFGKAWDRDGKEMAFTSPKFTPI